MKSYRPSRKAPLSGLLLLILFVLVGGIVIGGILFAASRIIYLVVLFPVIAGFVAGTVMTVGVLQGKIRNPFIAIVFSLAMGIVIYGTYFYGKYLIFQQVAYDTLVKQSGKNVDRATALDLFDKLVLQPETGSTGFVGFVKFAAKAGIQISPVASSSSSTTPLTGAGAYIYWGVEMAIIAVIAAGIAGTQARKPFSEDCNEWYSAARSVGSVVPTGVNDFLVALRSGNFAQARTFMGNQIFTLPRVGVEVLRSPSCPTADLVLKVDLATRRNRNSINHKTLALGLISPQEFSELTGHPIT